MLTLLLADTETNTFSPNPGCVPFTKMKLIGEALPLTRKPLLPYDPTEKTSNRTQWYQDVNEYVLRAPRELINAQQRSLFDCDDDNTTVCKIPIPPPPFGTRKEINADLFDMFEISFRDVLVPKFEQFLTKHARRVSGNVVIYDLLDSNSDMPKYGKARATVNTTKWDARCLVNDTNWYTKLVERASERLPRPDRPKSNDPLSYHTDIYRHFVDCYRTKPPITDPDQDRTLPFADPPDLRREKYFVFNRTNRNALFLPKKRNYVYIFRAVVVNTEYNRFTYCDQLETFFGLHVVKVPKQRSPLNWSSYLGIFVFIVLFVVFSYIYFARTYTWRTILLTNTKSLDDTDYEDALQAQLMQDEIDRQDPFKQLAQKVHAVTRWKRNLKRHQENVGLLNVVQQATSAAAPNRSRISASAAPPNRSRVLQKMAEQNVSKSQRTFTRR